MDTQKILGRIEGRISDLKTSAQAVSLKAGMSADGIRNWQRRIKRGESAASATTWLRRYAPPWLLTGNPTGALMRVSDPGVTVRHPVVGVIKMLTST